MTCYLYQLLFPNGKRYIGVTKDPAVRWKLHRAAALNGARYNIPLHSAIRKYSWNSVVKSVLVIGSKEYIDQLEEKAIAAFSARGATGYNLRMGGDHPIWAKSSREKIARYRKGRKHTDATKEKISKTKQGQRKGVPHSLEHRRKIGEAQLGKIISLEQRLKIGAASRAAFSKPEVRIKHKAAMKEWKHKTQLTARQFAFEHLEGAL